MKAQGKWMTIEELSGYLKMSRSKLCFLGIKNMRLKEAVKILSNYRRCNMKQFLLALVVLLFSLVSVQAQYIKDEERVHILPDSILDLPRDQVFDIIDSIDDMPEVWKLYNKGQTFIRDRETAFNNPAAAEYIAAAWALEKHQIIGYWLIWTDTRRAEEVLEWADENDAWYLHFVLPFDFIYEVEPESSAG